MKIAVGVQCRLNSTRLPCKALLKLSDTTVLGMTLSRSIFQGFPTYLLTSFESNDNLICNEGKVNNVQKVIRGSLHNVSSRYLSLIDEVGPDFIVRVTADNPLTEYRYINPMIGHMIKTNLPYAWVEPYSCADGVNLEIFTSDFFKQSFEMDQSEYTKEHVTSWMQNKIGDKACLNLLDFNEITPNNSEDMHFGIDTIEDYLKVSKIINFTESKERKWSDNNFPYYCISNAKLPETNYPIGRRHYP